MGPKESFGPTSDVNLIVLLKFFDQKKASLLTESMRAAFSAIQLRSMFLLQTEIAGAIDAFSVKVKDILIRHQVLFGEDPFVNLKVPRSLEIHRLKQVLLNLILRTRDAYVSRAEYIKISLL